MILQIHEEMTTTSGLDLVFSRFPLSIDQIWCFPGHVFIQILEIAQKTDCFFFKCVLASLYEGLSVRRSVGRSVGPSVRPSETHSLNSPKFDIFLFLPIENEQK